MSKTGTYDEEDDGMVMGTVLPGAELAEGVVENWYSCDDDEGCNCIDACWPAPTTVGGTLGLEMPPCRMLVLVPGLELRPASAGGIAQCTCENWGLENAGLALGLSCDILGELAAMVDAPRGFRPRFAPVVDIAISNCEDKSSNF